jgi:hypothetical protein
MNQRRQRAIGCAAAAVSLAAVLLCLSGGAAIRYGSLAAPVLNLHIGPLHVVAFTTFAASCPRQPPSPSSAGAIPSRGTYTILAFTPASGRPSNRNAHTLLELPLRC